jgi:hypothetical protein
MNITLPRPQNANRYLGSAETAAEAWRRIERWYGTASESVFPAAA